MSSASTPVTPEHFAYLAAHTRGEDPFLTELRAAAEAQGIPSIQVAPEQASFLQVLLTAAGARRVVEVGTLFGYAAIAMARALPEDGRLTTIELDGDRARFAREWIARSDVADRIEVREGRGEDVLAELAPGSVDAIFLDADKVGYARYLEQARELVRPGGLVLVDNAFAFGELFAAGEVEESVEAIRAFNDRMARTPGLHGIIVPVGDGMWVAVRER